MQTIICKVKKYIDEQSKTRKVVKLPLLMRIYLGESIRRNLKTQEKIAAEIGSKVQRFGGFKNAFVLFEDAKTEENIRRSSPLPVGDILKANERLETQVVEHFKRIQISIDS